MKKNILILEKERIIGFDLKVKFQEGGYNTIRTSGLLETKKILKEDIPNLVIADSLEFNNDELYSEVKKLCASHHVAMITTGYSIKNNEEIEVIGHFTKPYISEEITQLAMEHFKREDERKKIQQKILSIDQ